MRRLISAAVIAAFALGLATDVAFAQFAPEPPGTSTEDPGTSDNPFGGPTTPTDNPGTSTVPGPGTSGDPTTTDNPTSSTGPGPGPGPGTSGDPTTNNTPTTSTTPTVPAPDTTTTADSNSSSDTSNDTASSDDAGHTSIGTALVDTQCGSKLRQLRRVRASALQAVDDGYGIHVVPVCDSRSLVGDQRQNENLKSGNAKDLISIVAANVPMSGALNSHGYHAQHVVGIVLAGEQVTLYVNKIGYDGRS